jgi:hypothetical protein
MFNAISDFIVTTMIHNCSLNAHLGCLRKRAPDKQISLAPPKDLNATKMC